MLISRPFSRARLIFLAGFASALALLAIAGGAVLAYDALNAPAPAPRTETPRAALVDYGQQKVVYHVSIKGTWRDREAEAWRLAKVLGNHLNAVMPGDLELRVLFQGEGIDALRRAGANPQLAAAFAALKARGVKFRICANTLEAYRLGLDSLWDAKPEDLVPAAVAELAHLQRQGFSYIKF